MSNPFFDHPILNSPYECPRRHWELDPSGQPTQRVLEKRRRAEFITPIPKPKKRKTPAQQEEIVFDEGKGLSPSPAICLPIPAPSSSRSAMKMSTASGR
jgi:type III restriction enzyme